MALCHSSRWPLWEPEIQPSAYDSERFYNRIGESVAWNGIALENEMNLKLSD
jgi:hypothetical protein